LKEQGIVPPVLSAPKVQVSGLGDAARVPALQLVRDLRARGVGALLAFGARSLRAQLRSADRAGVAYTLVLGESELANGSVIARNMATTEQVSLPLAEAVAWLEARLS
jgi:histidyl-tRNA synthetase